MGVFLAASVGLVRGAAAAEQISHQGALHATLRAGQHASVTFAIYAAEDDELPERRIIPFTKTPTVLTATEDNKGTFDGRSATSNRGRDDRDGACASIGSVRMRWSRTTPLVRSRRSW